MIKTFGAMIIIADRNLRRQTADRRTLRKCCFRGMSGAAAVDELCGMKFVCCNQAVIFTGTGEAEFVGISSLVSSDIFFVLEFASEWKLFGFVRRRPRQKREFISR
jgi:hypothetical protein